MPEMAASAAGQAVRVAEAVAAAAAQFAAAGVNLPRDEARDIVAALLDRPRFWPALHGNDLLDVASAEQVREAVRRRVAGAPFAYAVGRAAFRHLTLEVDERVLIPRQETETLVELALAASRSQRSAAIDIGTGSGAIALALASEGNFPRVVATDVSFDALEVARVNARRLRSALRVPVEFRVGAGLAPVLDLRAGLIVANPPYIAYDEVASLPPEVRDWEPAVALVSGGGGLEVTRRIIRDAPSVLDVGGVLVLEVDERRAIRAAELATGDSRYAEVRVHRDLAGRDRFVLARRR